MPTNFSRQETLWLRIWDIKSTCEILTPTWDRQWHPWTGGDVVTQDITLLGREAGFQLCPCLCCLQTLNSNRSQLCPSDHAPCLYLQIFINTDKRHRTFESRDPPPRLIGMTTHGHHSNEHPQGPGGQESLLMLAYHLSSSYLSAPISSSCFVFSRYFIALPKYSYVTSLNAL